MQGKWLGLALFALGVLMLCIELFFWFGAKPQPTFYDFAQDCAVLLGGAFLFADARQFLRGKSATFGQRGWVVSGAAFLLLHLCDRPINWYLARWAAGILAVFFAAAFLTAWLLMRLRAWRNNKGSR